jgi:hypothetical protein
MIKKLKSIVWKDLLRPRYAIIVDVFSIPTYDGGWKSDKYPIAMKLPYKRPLSMGFYEFRNILAERNSRTSLIFCGSYRTIRGIYGIGSTEKHNMRNAIMVKPR